MSTMVGADRPPGTEDITSLALALTSAGSTLLCSSTHCASAAAVATSSFGASIPGLLATSDSLSGRARFERLSVDDSGGLCDRRFRFWVSSMTSFKYPEDMADKFDPNPTSLSVFDMPMCLVEG